MPSFWTCPDCGKPHPVEYRELPDEPTRCEACEVRAELQQEREAHWESAIWAVKARQASQAVSSARLKAASSMAEAELAEVRADNEALRRTVHILTASRGEPYSADENYGGTKWTGGEEE